VPGDPYHRAAQSPQENGSRHGEGVRDVPVTFRNGGVRSRERSFFQTTAIGFRQYLGSPPMTLTVEKTG